MVPLDARLPHPTRALTHSRAYRLASIFHRALGGSAWGEAAPSTRGTDKPIRSSANSITLQPSPDDRGVPNLDERLSLFPLAGEEALEQLSGTDRHSEDLKKDYAENLVFVSLFEPLVSAQISGLRSGSATDYLAIARNPDVHRRDSCFDVVSWVGALSLGRGVVPFRFALRGGSMASPWWDDRGESRGETGAVVDVARQALSSHRKQS